MRVSLSQAVVPGLLMVFRVALVVALGLVVAWIAIVIACSLLSWIDWISDVISSRYDFRK